MIHTHYTQSYAVSKTTREQSTRHYQTINRYRLILISKQTGHGVVCTDERVHTYIRTSVYTAHTSTRKYKHLCTSLITEQNEHNIGEVCINIYTSWTGMMQILYIKKYKNRVASCEIS